MSRTSKQGNPDVVVVYLILDACGVPVDCTISREQARTYQRSFPTHIVQRAIATPAPRKSGGA